MNKFFSEVDFSELEEKPQKTKVNKDDPLSGVETTVLMTDIRKMISAIENGQSHLVKGALDLNKTPVKTAVQKLEDFPSTESLMNFLNTAQQDVNRRFRQEVELILKQNNKFKEVIEEQEKLRKEKIDQELEKLRKQREAEDR